MEQGDGQASLLDAEQCVKLNPDWCKGHYRLAAAFEALDRKLEVPQTRQQRRVSRGKQNCVDQALISCTIDLMNYQLSSFLSPGYGDRKYPATSDVRNASSRFRSVTGFRIQCTASGEVLSVYSLL